MTQDEFNVLVTKRLTKCKKVLCIKAEDYANDKDRLHNFKDGAFLTGQTPEQYALSLITKHIIAIRDKLLKAEPMTPEFVSEKIGDIINYMLLMEAIITEEWE